MTTGGRENGLARSSDGALDIRLSNPGSNRMGTNPEQLIAIAWSASFASSVAQVLAVKPIKLRADVRIHAEVGLWSDEDRYLLGVRLDVTLPRLDREIAMAVIEEARRICPYSRATQGNVGLAFNLI